MVLDISDDVVGGKLTDEEYARRLQEAENNLASGGSTAATNSTVDEQLDNDEEYAQRLEMQLRDEQIAQNIQELENAQRSYYNQQRQQQLVIQGQPYDEGNNRSAVPDGFVDVSSPGGGRRKCCGNTHGNRKGRICKSLSSFAIVLVIVCLLLVFLTPLGKQIGIGELGDIPEILFGGENDWAGTPDASSFASWPTNGNLGLKLTIQNALTSDWNPYLSVAFQDWDAAPALELTLTTRKEGPDPVCSPVEGIMKVCNARYGKLGWVGLNEVYFNRKGFITQSVAKMNESYLDFSQQDEKQYVVCHEMGHGFGLPHRDENPNNANLGSCLDYTNRHEGNQHPDEEDYQNLENLYGRIDAIDGVYGGKGGRRKLAATKTEVVHPQYGRLLQTHGNNRGASYERSHSNGGTIVTNVLWTL